MQRKTTVSYTHLDVYKRQDSTYVAKNQVSETGERKPIKSVSTGIKKKKVTKTEEPVIVPVKVEEIPNYEGAP